MAERFVEVDRNTPMLLPADLRDWVPEDDLVHFVIEAVKTLPTAEFVVNERGTGYAQYPPSMVLALVIYCYRRVDAAICAAKPVSNQSLGLLRKFWVLSSSLCVACKKSPWNGTSSVWLTISNGSISS